MRFVRIIDQNTNVSSFKTEVSTEMQNGNYIILK